MDSLGEIIVPIIVFAIWLIGQIFGKKEEEQAPPPQHRQAAPPPTPAQQQDHREEQYRRQQQQPQPASDEERTRRIQEEIRRKIAERRGQQPVPQQGPPPPPPAQPQPAPQRKPLDYGRPGESSPPPLPTYQEHQPFRDYEAELEEQRQRVEATKRRAEEARQAAKVRLGSVMGNDISSSAKTAKGKKRTGAFAQRIRKGLRDPEAAREAFVYMEVLGNPVGQRRDGAIRRSWE